MAPLFLDAAGYLLPHRKYLPMTHALPLKLHPPRLSRLASPWYALAPMQQCVPGRVQQLTHVDDNHPLARTLYPPTHPPTRTTPQHSLRQHDAARNRHPVPRIPHPEEGLRLPPREFLLTEANPAPHVTAPVAPTSLEAPIASPSARTSVSCCFARVGRCTSWVDLDLAHTCALARCLCVWAGSLGGRVVRTALV